jgi:hypothetical protein
MDSPEAIRINGVDQLLFMKPQLLVSNDVVINNNEWLVTTKTVLELKLLFYK